MGRQGGDGRKQVVCVLQENAGRDGGGPRRHKVRRARAGGGRVVHPAKGRAVLERGGAPGFCLGAALRHARYRARRASSRKRFVGVYN